MRNILIALALSALTFQVFADEPMPSPPAGAIPGDEAPPRPEEMAEPTVTIRRRGSDTIEEYRINGRLYMVKITPSKGFPYYLIDNDGDGSLETRRNDLDNPPTVQWRILSW